MAIPGLPGIAFSGLVITLFFTVDQGVFVHLVLHAAIATGLIGHGVFDAIAHLRTDSPALDWRGPFCIGVGMALGVRLLALPSEPTGGESR